MRTSLKQQANDKCALDKIICVEMNVNSFRLNFSRERETALLISISFSSIRKIHNQNIATILSMNHWIQYTD